MKTRDLIQRLQELPSNSDVIIFAGGAKLSFPLQRREVFLSDTGTIYLFPNGDEQTFNRLIEEQQQEFSSL